MLLQTRPYAGEIVVERAKGFDTPSAMGHTTRSARSSTRSRAVAPSVQLVNAFGALYCG